MKNSVRNLIIIIVVTLIFSTNAFAKQPLQYKTITYDAIARVPHIAKWYRKNCHKQGFHYGIYKEKIYVLISGGKKETSGYKVVLNQVKRLSRGALYITADVVPPLANQPVAHTASYPCLLIKIDDPRILRVEGKIMY